jgi:SAM-dependent methyltransferase
MRKVYYIAGITASGKTTLAGKLSEQLGLPLLMADHILDDLGKALYYTRPDKLALPENMVELDQVKIAHLKEMIWKERIGKVGGDFVVEGFTLGFENERKIVDRVLGEHQKVFFYLDPPFSLWAEYAEDKGYRPNLSTFNIWKKYFEPPEDYYHISDPSLIFLPYEKYQREGLTDLKWEALKMPKSFEGKSVLDIGCNDGQIGRYCLDRGAKEVQGIDINWQNVENAKAKGIGAKLKSFNDPMWGNNFPQFDYVFALAMFHYVLDKDRFLDECAKLTRGEFILELPVCQKGGFLWERYHEKYLIPSVDLITEMLKKRFPKVGITGKSICPDGMDNRLIFRCRKGKE